MKTAGTSYLEALKTHRSVDEDFIARNLRISRGNAMKWTGPVIMSRRSSGAPPCRKRSPIGADLLDQFDAREILHVTFGSVPTEKTQRGEWRFRDRFMDFLRANPETYAANLESHFIRHLTPFVSR